MEALGSEALGSVQRLQGPVRSLDLKLALGSVCFVLYLIDQGIRRTLALSVASVGRLNDRSRESERLGGWGLDGRTWVREGLG